MLYINGQSLALLAEITFMEVTLLLNYKQKIRKILINVGQKDKSSSAFTDQENKAISFNSDIDLMNYLSISGWGLLSYKYKFDVNTGQSQKILFFIKKENQTIH